VTAGDPLTGSPGPSAVLADDDTESCLCLVAGYAKGDGLIARVTAEAERQVMMSPMLGDFLQLRYVDLGPRPGPGGEQSGPVRRIVADLMAAHETAGRSHFALVVMAKSATAIEELLISCAAEPFLAGLRMRFAGIASSDDRSADQGFGDITSSPEGRWRDERELIEALRQRCEELPRGFAARGEPGLTRAELATLRQAHEQPVAEGDGTEDGTGGMTDESAVPDVLDDVPEAAAMASGPGPAAVEAPADAADGAPGRSVPGRLTASRAPSWRPAVPWRRRKQPAGPGDAEGAAPAEPAPETPEAPKAMGLVYLLMIVDQNAAADAAAGRLQAALLDVDRRLAEEPSCGYQIRVIHGGDGYLRGQLQDAGTLGRRAAKRLVKTGDFAALLKGIRGSLRRDRGLIEAIATAAGRIVAPPAVIIFTADPPMADLDATTVFHDIAAEATVVWVVPGKLEGLVSPAFGAVCGAAVLGQHQAVADEVLDRIRAALEHEVSE
jgi:hypothetical protein